MISYKIDINDAGMRLDRYVRKLLPNAKASLLYKSIRKKNITRNGKKAKQEDILEVGDTVEVYFSDEAIEKFSKTSRKIRGQFPKIVLETDDFIVMNKPVGVLSHGTGKKFERNMVDDMLTYLIHTKSYNPRLENTFTPSISNRLDRNTSGLILGAKNAEALRAANAWLRERKLEKYYLTIVEGRLTREETVENQLKKDGDKNRVREGEGGKAAKGIYRPLAYKNGYTLVEADLITGRTHQIRQQLASIGFPIVGDQKYGKKSARFPSLHHQLLHAYRLVFPRTEEFPDVSEKKIVAEPAGKFKEAMDALGFSAESLSL
ncbi:MAG: RluA family pseudouridine synthase [Peptoniphilus sp.]|nr:RluA family pseudouridine synthase [Peptoniphilus sp.]MDD7363641.1 RluA family pseudouridine synthase [Bacillota bacterium]MDY6044713.1 RluA family pseudouridine synthase [Peptoniphilus sp.]